MFWGFFQVNLATRCLQSLGLCKKRCMEPLNVVFSISAFTWTTDVDWDLFYNVRQIKSEKPHMALLVNPSLRKPWSPQLKKNMLMCMLMHLAWTCGPAPCCWRQLGWRIQTASAPMCSPDGTAHCLSQIVYGSEILHTFRWVLPPPSASSPSELS